MVADAVTTIVASCVFLKHLRNLTQLEPSGSLTNSTNTTKMNRDASLYESRVAQGGGQSATLEPPQLPRNEWTRRSSIFF